ncbi:NDR1/HIN1-like protein 10 [Papaver somniferum]|uniref:NDR1/HIN1-like protein 10 n=1 Tax=Papaver somniferum TaxID=3469 RepID=UPI000E6FD849|nr:NDR1/HIN1-like protein 10 [Papaver somniferum]
MGDSCSEKHVCLYLLIMTILFGGIVFLKLFSISAYENMKFHVIDASLKEFYLTNDDILHYNFAVTISVRNSNKVARISYGEIRSKIYCYGEDLGFVPLYMSFWQGPKNTTLLHPVFKGKTLFKLRGSRLEDFSYGQRDGSYIIYVYLYLTVQVKHAGGGKGLEEDYIIECGLYELHLLGSSSLPNNQTGIGGLFKTKRCGVYKEHSL